jgi:hypothetical protein
MKQNKTFKIILTLCCFLAFSVTALASNTIPGVGVVIKRNPGSGASKATTGKDGSFSLEMTKGSYLISLDKDQLMKAGQELVKTSNPKSNYLFNGDGTQLVIADNENIIMSQLEGDVNSDLVLITVLKPTILKGSVLWDDTVVSQDNKVKRIGHVTLLKRNASQSLQIFCPTGTVGLNGACVPIKDLENTPVGKSADYVGHVTLLKKNSSAMKVATTTDCPQGFELKNGVCVPITTVTTGAEMAGGPIQGQIIANHGHGTHKVKRTGHVTLLRFSKPQIYIGGGIVNPSGTTKETGMVNGIDLNLSVYKPIWAWEQSNISLGINAGGGYTMGNGSYSLDNRYTVYQLQGQSATPVVSEKGTGSPKSQGFKFEAGPQMNIHLGEVTLSPIFNLGYLSMTQKELNVTETVQLNTVDYPYDLLTQKETKTSGLGIIPKVRLAYNITPMIGIWVEGNYTMGSKIETESTRFVLDPTIPSDSYNLGHFQEGQYVTTKASTKYTAMGVSGGIVISLGRGSNSPKQQNFKNETVETTNIKGGGIFKCSCCDQYFDTAVLAYNHSKTCSKCTTTSTPTSTVGGKMKNDDSWYNNETGQITYFEYTEDFVIDAPEICTDLGVKRLIIQKGKYTVERKTTEEGGKIVLTLKEPIAVEKIKNTASRKFEGTNPKGLNCNGPGNACFYVSGEKNKTTAQPFTLTPVIEKGQCTNVVVQYQRSERGSGPPKNQGF